MSQKYEYFGKYILLEKLATGGMAEVFLARAPGAGGIGRFCAIKRILPQYSDNNDFIRMFKDEAKIAVNLSHSNIVSIYEFGVEANQFFLVMDYVEGRNLRQILNKMKKGNATFSVDQVVYVVKEVAAGLDHAHRCLDTQTGKPLSITHRDMSPQNVMVSFEGEVKIVDFGIAKAESQLETTRAGTLKGKFGYMSPEQAEGMPVDLRTDIFSLGIVLWEMLANDRLFIASNELNTLKKIRDCQVPSLRKFNPSIHPELERIVTKCLAKDRNFRYQTAAALFRDLNRYLNRQYPDFSAQDFSVFTKTLFADEILGSRKRLVEYSKVPALELTQSPSQPSHGRSSLKPTKPDPSASPEGSEASVAKSEQSQPSVGGISFNFKSDDPSLPSAVRAPDSKSESQLIERNEPPEGLGRMDAEVDPETTPVASSISNVAPAPQPLAQEIEEPSERIVEPTPTFKPNPQMTTRPAPAPARSNPARPPTFGPPRVREDSDEAIVAVESQPRIRMEHLRTDNFAVRRGPPAGVVTLTLLLTALLGFYLSDRQAPETMRPIHNIVFGLLESVGLKNHVVSALRVMDPVYAVRFDSESSLATMAEPPSDKPMPTTAVTPPPASPPVATPPTDESCTTLDEMAGKCRKAPGDAKGATRTFIVIGSSPSNAEIAINGQSTGNTTPAKVEVPADGAFTVTLTKRGFHPYSRKITADEAGRNFKPTLLEAEMGFVSIDVFPSALARIFIDGREINDRLPIRDYQIMANKDVVIEARNPRTNQSVQQQVSVVPGERKSVLLRLDKGRQPSQRQ